MRWTAGVARGDITPALPVWLAGYGDRSAPAESVHEPLEVRVLAVTTDDGAPLLLVALDLLLLAPEMAAPLRDAVAAQLEVPRSSVLTTCVHVHGGPGVLRGGEAVGWPMPEGYADLLVERVVATSRRALASSRPVTPRFSRAPLPAGVAVNRRGHHLDPSVAVLDLVAEDVAAAERIATVANLGMHPTVSGPSNLAVGTDWVGPFRRAVEAAVGGTCLFVQGCQGDINPAVTAWEDGEPAAWSPVATEVGTAAAAAAVAAVRSASAVRGPVRLARARTVAVPVDEGSLLGALTGGGPTRDVELIEWCLGDVTLLNVPGEGFHRLEQAVRSARGDRVLLVGLAPDWHGYLPVPFTEGYEEALSLGAGAVSAIGAALVGDPRAEL